MKRASQTTRLQALRAQLQHFNDSPDFGDAEAVEIIRQHLLLRIREAEGDLRTRARAQAHAATHIAFQSEAA
jgi:hypothetical protein